MVIRIFGQTTLIDVEGKKGESNIVKLTTL
jgi:hypothetical protein